MNRKRFYKTVSIAEGEGGFAVELDGRSVRTPAGNTLRLPNRALAEAIAAEWSAQGENIVPESLPLTKLANSAIDSVVGHQAAVLDGIASYAASDLICYRANSPAELSDVQAAVWDPVLAWAKERFDAPFRVTEGVRHVEQPAAAILNLRKAIEHYGPFQLAALHVMTTLTGSVLLSLAHVVGVLNLAEIWAASQVDENWQMAHWGADFEASQRQERKFEDMKAASRFFVASSHRTKH